MPTLLDRIRRMQENHSRFRDGSSEEYREALPAALVDLAWCVAFAVAAAEFCTPAQLETIARRTEALLAAGRVIAKSELRERIVG